MSLVSGHWSIVIGHWSLVINKGQMTNDIDAPAVKQRGLGGFLHERLLLAQR
ncbi:MAG: hypothetical protein V7L25_20665 [Nostoc sp.]